MALSFFLLIWTRIDMEAHCRMGNWDFPNFENFVAQLFQKSIFWDFFYRCVTLVFLNEFVCNYESQMTYGLCKLTCTPPSPPPVDFTMDIESLILSTHNCSRWESSIHLGLFFTHFPPWKTPAQWFKTMLHQALIYPRPFLTQLAPPTPLHNGSKPCPICHQVIQNPS